MNNHYNNGNLPKFLVQKFGEENIRRLCGLGEPSQKMLKKRNKVQLHIMVNGCEYPARE
jgi:hypothetical protein